MQGKRTPLAPCIGRVIGTGGDWDFCPGHRRALVPLVAAMASGCGLLVAADRHLCEAPRKQDLEVLDLNRSRSSGRRRTAQRRLQV
jgi:hypothetical protein